MYSNSVAEVLGFGATRNKKAGMQVGVSEMPLVLKSCQLSMGLGNRKIPTNMILLCLVQRGKLQQVVSFFILVLYIRTLKQAADSHSNYWNQYSGHYEHWRFESGFNRGWQDAYLFFNFAAGSSVSELGFKDEWAKRRLAEHASDKGKTNLWEFGK
jgi:hypothetical protein